MGLHWPCVWDGTVVPDMAISHTAAATCSNRSYLPPDKSNSGPGHNAAFNCGSQFSHFSPWPQGRLQVHRYLLCVILAALIICDVTLSVLLPLLSHLRLPPLVQPLLLLLSPHALFHDFPHASEPPSLLQVLSAAFNPRAPPTSSWFLQPLFCKSASSSNKKH